MGRGMSTHGALATALLAIVTSLSSPQSAGAAETPSAVQPPRFVPPRDGTGPVARPPAIRFVTTDDFPPFNFVDATGKLTGFNVELARAICRRLATTCTIQVRPFPLLVDALVENRADAAIAGVRDTPRLRRFVGYTESYLKLPARFVVRRETTTAATPEALAGKTVAVPAGTRYRAFLADFFPGATLLETDGDQAALDAVRDRKAEAAFVGSLGASFWMQGADGNDCCVFADGAYTEPAYFGKGLSIAVRADDDVLRAALDDALRAVETDGVTADLYMRFFPVSLY